MVPIKRSPGLFEDLVTEWWFGALCWDDIPAGNEEGREEGEDHTAIKGVECEDHTACVSYRGEDGLPLVCMYDTIDSTPPITIYGRITLDSTPVRMYDTTAGDEMASM